MSMYKIIFTGPVGAGKTTAISTLSDVDPVTTDVQSSDMAKSRKQSTTVALDYGVVRLSGGERIHLYGTPGQERFDFMWEILTNGGAGLVLLLDNTRENPFQDLTFFLNAYKRFVKETTVVIGVTQSDIGNGPGIEQYRQELEPLGLAAQVFMVDARRRKDVSMLVHSLMNTLDHTFSDRLSGMTASHSK